MNIYTFGYGNRGRDQLSHIVYSDMMHDGDVLPVMFSDGNITPVTLYNHLVGRFVVDGWTEYLSTSGKWRIFSPGDGLVHVALPVDMFMFDDAQALATVNYLVEIGRVEREILGTYRWVTK